MCGICGIVDFNGISKTDDSKRVINRMVNKLENRGPDGSDIKVHKTFMFGHSRLSIIDLSNNASQPMNDLSNNLTITFNGEIYNYIELRQELLSLGFEFKTHSDTEVILNGYRAYGIEGILNKCKGMWALAIYDKQRDELILARDRFGEKPLYYYHVDNKVAFASTTYSLREFTGTLSINKAVLAEYLNYGFVPPNSSIIRGVDKVQPGTFITISKNNEHIKNYWNLEIKNQPHSTEVAMEKIESLLVSSIRRSLVADVEVGAFLSGGLDSGLVTALASKEMENFKTYTMTVPGKSLDESKAAGLTAQYCGTIQKNIEVNEKSFDVLEEVAKSYSEPFADPSMIPIYLLSKMVSKYSKVVITGDGGDEGFSAYNRINIFNDIIKNSQFSPKGLMGVMGDYLWNSPPILLANRGRYRARHWLIGKGGIDSFLDTQWQLLNYTTAKMLLGDEVQELIVKESPIKRLLSEVEDIPDWKKILYVGIKFELPGDFLNKVDTGTMDFGLEARCPFLDHDLISYLINLDYITWNNGDSKKGLLEPILKRYLPNELFSFPKRGFSIPLNEYMLDYNIIDKIKKILSTALCVELGLIKRKGIETLINWHRSSSRPDYRISRLLFSVVTLEYWLREWYAYE